MMQRNKNRETFWKMSTTGEEFASFKDELGDVTTCCICDETYTDPMILPCIHTFCLTCLQHIGSYSKKNAGDQMPCPLCRQEFTIPEDGFAAFKKNFFMFKLIEITTSHQGSSTEGQCDKHEHENLCLYCSKCDEVLCLVCFRESHQSHQLWDLSNIAMRLRSRLQRDVSTVKRWTYDTLKKQEGLLQTKSADIKEIQGIETEVNQLRFRLKALIDQHADSLLKNLDLLRKERIQNIEIEERELDKYLSCLKNFEMSSADAYDHNDGLFCKKANELKEETVQLELMQKSISARELRSFEIHFTATELTALEFYKVENIIGALEENCDYTEKPELVMAIGANNTIATLHDDISGMAVLYDEVFVAYGKNPVVSTYDTYTRRCKSQMILKDLVDEIDFTNCVCADGNVYIGNRKTKEILRIDRNGDFMKWSTKAYCNGISVSPESTIIVATYSGPFKRASIQEYSVQGTLLHETELCWSITSALHAIKLSSGHFAVSYFSEYFHFTDEDEFDYLYEVSIVHTDGRLAKSFSGFRNLNICPYDPPTCLAEDEDGNILILDRRNSRVLVLSPDLKFRRVLLTKADGLRRPVAMHLDENTGRLYIADNDWTNLQWNDSKVLVFNIR